MTLGVYSVGQFWLLCYDGSYDEGQNARLGGLVRYYSSRSDIYRSDVKLLHNKVLGLGNLCKMLRLFDATQKYIMNSLYLYIDILE